MLKDKIVVDSSRNFLEPLQKEKPSLEKFEKIKCENLYSENETIKIIHDYIHDCLLALGYKESFLYSNIRLILTICGCITGLYAAIIPKFPNDLQQLKISVIVFFLFFFSLSFFEWFFLKSTVVILKYKNNPKIFVEAFMDRWESKLVLKVRSERMKLSFENDFGEYYDTEGYLETDNLFNDLKKLLVDFECGITDKSKQYLNKSNKDE